MHISRIPPNKHPRVIYDRESRSSRSVSKNSQDNCIELEVPADTGAYHVERSGVNNLYEHVAAVTPITRVSCTDAFLLERSLLPSRLSGHGAAGSPMTSVPLSFVPNAPGQLDFRPSNAFTDVMLSPQAELAHGFVPLMPPSPGEWHMHPPALKNFPMAAHFLPGFDEAPDFSPVN